MRYSQAVEAYLDARSNEQAYNTVRTNRTHLKKLLNQYGDIELDSIDQRLMNGAFSIWASTMAPGSLNVTLGTYRGFFAWCREEELMPATWNPLKGQRQRRPNRNHRPRIPAADFSRLLDHAPCPRSRFLVALGLYCMPRASEVQLMTIGDLDLEAKYLRMTIPKTTDTDELPLTDDFIDEAERYLDWYASIVGPLKEHYYLIPSTIPGKGKFKTREITPLLPHKHLHGLLVPALEAYGLENHKGLKLHLLRRSGARGLYDALADSGLDSAIEVTQAALHHRSRNMTEHYIGLEGGRAKRDKILRGARLYTNPTPTANVIPLHRTG